MYAQRNINIQKERQIDRQAHRYIVNVNSVSDNYCRHSVHCTKWKKKENVEAKNESEQKEIKQAA